jgi:hypothetical protein
MKLSSAIISLIDSEDHKKPLKKEAYKRSSINLVSITDFTHNTVTNFQSNCIRFPIIKKKICHKQILSKDSNKNSLLISNDKLDTNLPSNNGKNEPAYCFPKRDSLAPIFLYKRALKPQINSLISPKLSAHSRNYQSKYYHHLLITSLNSQNTSTNLNT